MSKIQYFVVQAILLIATVQSQNVGFDDEKSSSSRNNCRTPNGSFGSCSLLVQCNPILEIFATRVVTPELTQYFIASTNACGGGINDNNPIVCCPTANAGVTSRGSDLLPSAECGKGSAYRIVGGNKTELDEFPWTVLLEYRKPYGRTTACGGSLINNRYVVTAAHCVTGPSLGAWRLTGARLGEWDTSSARDCVPDGQDTFLCSDDPITLEIEKTIIHESYVPNRNNEKYDLALLRLARPVAFTRYIKPICLPTSRNLPDRLWTTGWGKTENRSSSDIKLKVSLPPVDLETCRERFRSIRFTPGESQICAGGERGKDSCNGDSGGPLMSMETRSNGEIRWALAGVVSVGPTKCGIKGQPGIYTRISDYVSWIESKLEP